MCSCLFQRKQLKCNRFYLYGQLRISSPVWIISYESVWEYLIWKPFLYQALGNQNHSLSICKNQIFMHCVTNQLLLRNYWPNYSPVLWRRNIQVQQVALKLIKAPCDQFMNHHLWIMLVVVLKVLEYHLQVIQQQSTEHIDQQLVHFCRSKILWNSKKYRWENGVKMDQFGKN